MSTCKSIKHNPNFADHWPFVLCMENAGMNMVAQAKECAASAGLDYSAIETCYKGAEGLRDLLEARKSEAAILLVSHRPSYLAMCGREIVLEGNGPCGQGRVEPAAAAPRGAVPFGREVAS